MKVWQKSGERFNILSVQLALPVDCLVYQLKAADIPHMTCGADIPATYKEQYTDGSFT